MNWRRQRGRRKKHERALKPQPLFASDHDRPAEAETEQAIEEALRGLPAAEREVVVMRIWGGLSFPQIGEALSVSSSTADTRYRSGLKRLRLALVGKENV
jgi:RNA polymerase sigma-70 factor (ECF subfamily)